MKSDKRGAIDFFVDFLIPAFFAWLIIQYIWPALMRAIAEYREKMPDNLAVADQGNQALVAQQNLAILAPDTYALEGVDQLTVQPAFSVNRVFVTDHTAAVPTFFSCNSRRQSSSEDRAVDARIPGDLDVFLKVCLQGKLNEVKYFIQNNFNPRQRYSDGYTILHWMAKNVNKQNYSTAVFLVEQYPDLLKIQHRKGRTPLETAEKNLKTARKNVDTERCTYEYLYESIKHDNFVAALVLPSFFKRNTPAKTVFDKSKEWRATEATRFLNTLKECLDILELSELYKNKREELYQQSVPVSHTSRIWRLT